MLKNFMVICSLSLCLFVPHKDNLNLNNTQSPRQVVCCENMHRVSSYYVVHSAQTGNYPMCTATGYKTSYCSNCYVTFERVITTTYEHEHPEAF